MKTGWQMEWEFELQYKAPMRARYDALHTAITTNLVPMKTSFGKMIKSMGPISQQLHKFSAEMEKADEMLRRRK